MQIAISFAILAFSIPIIIEAGANGVYGNPCSSSDECQGILTCERSVVGGYQCLCPRFLVPDMENNACRTALGIPCQRNSECVRNAQCVMKRLQRTHTCQCITGMKANETGNGCLQKTFFENIRTFFADLGPFWSSFLSFIVSGMVGAMIKIGWSYKKEC